MTQCRQASPAEVSVAAAQGALQSWSPGLLSWQQRQLRRIRRQVVRRLQARQARKRGRDRAWVRRPIRAQAETPRERGAEDEAQIALEVQQGLARKMPLRASLVWAWQSAPSSFLP